MKQNHFSLIELMAIIVVIFVLLTLTFPSIAKIRIKAKTVICAQQLKQIGALISTYSNDNDGYLPNSFNGSAPRYKDGSYHDKSSKGILYSSWSGHLIPYLNLDLKTWNMGDPGLWGGLISTYDFNTEDITRTSLDISDPDTNNWQLMHDMYFEGGYGPLKLFVCPEIFDNPIPSYTRQNYEVPNFSGIIRTYWRTYGLPTTYKANGSLFGNSDYKNSLRYEDIDKQNILLLEGGHSSVHSDNGFAHTFKSGMKNYRRFFSFTNQTGFAANNLNNGKRNSNGEFSTGPDTHALYMHDDSNELWISDWGRAKSFIKVIRFNKINAPFAAASGSYLNIGTRGGTSVASSIYPGENYDQFKVKSILNLSLTLNEKQHYYKENIGAGSAFGYMNILTGDLSVKKAHIGWLYENGKRLGMGIR